MGQPAHLAQIGKYATGGSTWLDVAATIAGLAGVITNAWEEEAAAAGFDSPYGHLQPANRLPEPAADNYFRATERGRAAARAVRSNSSYRAPRYRDTHKLARYAGPATRGVHKPMFRRSRSASAGKRRRVPFVRSRARSSFARRPTMARGASARMQRMPATRGAVVRGPELKSLDFPLQANVPEQHHISTTATFDLLNGIQEGSSFYNRIGRRVQMRSIHITGNLIFSGNGSGVPEYLRVMLIYDRQPNGAAPVISDVLTDYDSQGATTTNSFSKMNMNNVERFAILRDQRIQIAENNTGSAIAGAPASILNYSTQGNINMFVKLAGLETHFKASSNPAVIGDVATGALWLVTFGSIAVANAGIDIQYQSRLRYIDV